MQQRAALATWAFGKRMADQGSGKIITVSSVAALVGRPYCLLLQEMPGRCPARVCCAVATAGRLRPSWDFAVVRRCAGGVLQRGGPKGQQRVWGCLCRGVGSFP